MPLYYAGEELLLEDISGEVKTWLDRYLPFEEINLFGQPPVFLSEQTGSRSGCSDPVSLPIPNYPAAPPLKINSLYWPTGATRWARIVCLANEATKDRIIEAVHVRGEGAVQSGTLVVSANRANNVQVDSFTNGTLATEMYLLPPRPVSEVDALGPQTQTLWLIPLVDIRYFWQYRHVGEFEPATWNAAFVSLAESLGVTITRSDISEAYDIPSPAEHWRPYANAAYMLDAVAWSIGHRITRAITGEVFSESANDALDTLETNLSEETERWMQVAGGIINPGNHIAGLIPEKVTIVFRTDGEVTAAIEESATDHGYTGYVPDTRKVIHTNFPYDADDTTDADALATQIASDYYAWHSKRYDRAFIGVKQWTPSGFDDYLEWSIGRRRSDGTFEAQTRVQTFPYNFGVEEQPQSGTDCASSGGGGFVVLFEICEACCVECWADVTILSKSSSEAMPLTGQLLTECADCEDGEAYEKQLLDNQIRVYDVMGCMLDEPNEDLVGRRGYARYMFNDAKDCDGETITLTCNRCGDEVEFPSPRWEVFELCPYEDPCV